MVTEAGDGWGNEQDISDALDQENFSPSKTSLWTTGILDLAWNYVYFKHVKLKYTGQQKPIQAHLWLSEAVTKCSRKGCCICGLDFHSRPTSKRRQRHYVVFEFHEFFHVSHSICWFSYWKYTDLCFHGDTDTKVLAVSKTKRTRNVFSKTYLNIM